MVMLMLRYVRGMASDARKIVSFADKKLLTKARAGIYTDHTVVKNQV